MDRDREAFEAWWRDFDLGDGVRTARDLAVAHIVWQAALAYVREGVEWKKGSLEEVGTTDRGYTIFREVNEVGGHRYWSDEIGGGVVAWDTCLVDAGTLQECLRIEKRASALSELAAADGELLSPVTESSGCVFRDLNVSPPEKE